MAETESKFSKPDIPDWLKKQLVSPGVHPDALKTIYASQSNFDEVIYQDEHEKGVPVSNFSLESHGRGRGRPYLLAVVCERLYGDQRKSEEHGHDAGEIHGHIYALSPRQIRHLVTWLQGWLAEYDPAGE